MEKYTYLLLNFLTLIIPFAFSFEKKIRFRKKWMPLFIAILISGVIFIAWDIAFTDMGIWSFNGKYLAGIWIFGLPLEEILFFITIPYACVFVYENVKHFIKIDPENPAGKIILLLVTFFLLFCMFAFDFRWYTHITAIGLIVLLSTNIAFFKFRFLIHFWIAYLICLIPFGIVNGVLTSLPVVLYNDSENLATRIGSIPVEDAFYFMFLFLLNVNIFEIAARKWRRI